MRFHAARRLRPFLLPSLFLAALVSSVSLAGATAPVPPSAQPQSAAQAFHWDGRAFPTAALLRGHVEARGVGWERFLAARPAVVRAFALRPVRWGGRAFFAQRSLRHWLAAHGRSFGAWADAHPDAAARLRANGAARFRPVLATGREQPSQRPAPQAAKGPAGSKFGVSPDNIEYLDAKTQDRVLDEIAAVGAGWIRFDVKWAATQWNGPESWDWSRYDRLVDGARARGLRILATLAYTPPWARPDGCTGGLQCAPRSMEAFGAWAQVVVQRYRGRIDHWEIWNESNFAFWRPQPDPAAYVAMLKAVYPRIKSVAPEATVLAGATAPAPSNGWSIDEVAFLQRVYAHGGKGLFDVWSHHPYSQPHPASFDHPDNAWQQMSGTRTSIRSVLAAHGDGDKQVWATEFGSPTSGTPNAVSEETQARHLTEAFGLWKSYDWAGVLFWYCANDMSAYGSSAESGRFHGLVRSDWSRKPAWAAFKAAA